MTFVAIRALRVNVESQYALTGVYAHFKLKKAIALNV